MKILAGIDLSDSTPEIIKKVKELSKALSAEVWLLHAAAPEPDFIGYDPGPQSVRDNVAKTFHREHAEIQDIAEQLRKAGIESKALLVQDDAASAIVKEAAKLDVDMIVVGSHGWGAVHQLLMGSVSEGVLHKAKCPVLFVPTHKRT
jgi:nucleotide-binding universal stress UspA family protein